jgi:hypothetical protein
MATTTTNFGWDIPQSTDLVKDGATAIATLGQDIDTAFVDLKGGTSGQVLAKNSSTDLDFTWVAQDDSNAIQNAIVDAKGDLIAASAADTPARLAVGTNGQVLTADSTASTGLAWTTIASGASFTGVRVYSVSGSISVPNNTVTTLNFNGEAFDTNGFHSTTTDTSRLTVPSGKAGYYYIFADLQYAAGTAPKLQAQITVNGNVLGASAHPAAGGDFNSSCLTYTLANLAVGDYVELKARQITGGSIDAKMNNENETTLSMFYLGA